MGTLIGVGVSSYTNNAVGVAESIGNLTAHYAAHSLDLSNNDPVENWGDESGIAEVTCLPGVTVNPDGATDTTANSNRPTYHQSVLNGYPVVRFTAANKQFLVDDVQASVSLSSAFFVIKFSESVFSDYDPLLSGRTTSAPIVGENATTNIYTVGWTASQYVDGVSGNDISPMNNWHIVNMNRTSAISFGNLQFGHDRVFTTRWLDADIAEAVVYDEVLSVTQIQQVFTYLNNKYAVY